ncbi:aldehyde-activating protein [Pseudoalteromonas luteoviolacea]|uniref:Aldehyde-activating protein n=1 Tax=Pseudoalteromonas luteoviolacea TaxID=43657 RepID=A0A1C0TV46_9GAMM|nr:GFA family protein [Pseudoalteromonas luteoviolacea]MBQ4809738.1 GFA family protein [Pseudoalteromonas luteoviolacea]OCQ23193.1 aldehyde-activating protein [Pseudoalteromonas luteoviolacea]
MKVIKGGCNCKAVSFEFKVNASAIYMCHCSICRRATGVNGVAVMIASKTDFKWCSGTRYIKTWRKPEHDWVCSFCTECGSSLPGENDDQRMYIPAGLVSNEYLQGIRVTHHLWVESKACWDEIGDDGKQHLKSMI